MGKIKIYSSNTRGNVDYKLKKLIRELEPIIERKMITDPNFAASFRPATSPDELHRLHSVHCAETATILSETKNEPTNLSNMETETHNSESNKSSEAASSAQNKTVIDPINEADPIIRDYVLQDDAYEKKSSIPSPDARNNDALNFSEPMNFQDAFDIPADDNEDPKIGNKKESEQKQGPSQNNTQQSAPKKEPVNPYFDEQSNQNKKKQTKRMAKYIVKVVVTLLEKGFVWWTTKEINEAKLIELELKGEIDLNILLALSETEQQTAREFFARMCKDAIAGSKVDVDDQEELTDALYEVLIEKGIAPTPMQNLALVGLQIVGAKVLTALGLSAMTNSVLSGLKENHKQTMESEAEDEEELVREAHKGKDSANSKEESANSTNSDEKYEDAQIVN
jgi:hypothetical protein